LKDLNHDLYVAETADGILGFASIGYYKSIREGGRRAVIECLHLLPAAAASAKRKLLEWAVGRAKKKNCRRLEASGLSVEEEVLEGAGLLERGCTRSLFLGE
jgi:hypothetical protein